MNALHSREFNLNTPEVRCIMVVIVSKQTIGMGALGTVSQKKRNTVYPSCTHQGITKGFFLPDIHIVQRPQAPLLTLHVSGPWSHKPPVQTKVKQSGWCSRHKLYSGGWTGRVCSRYIWSPAEVRGFQHYIATLGVCVPDSVSEVVPS